MDRERLSPPPEPLSHASQEGPLLLLETVSEPEDSPCVTTPVIESEPLPQDLHCTRSSATSHASASNVPCQQARPLHVQFNAQSLELEHVSSSSSSSPNDEELSITEARSFDGGWGCVIVFASFMIKLITDGIAISFGMLLPYFVDYFREGKEKTACIVSIFMAMPLLSGPIASFLINRYGLRRITIFGSVLAFLGFVISTFVDNVETLFLTIGILAGFGVSLCNVASVVTVAYYFEKKRCLATGVSACGSGAGVYIFDPLTNILLEKYDWQGTILIFAGFLLNMAVCGLLFRDLPWMAAMNEERAKERERRKEKKRNKRFGPLTDTFSDSKSSAVGSTKVSDAVDTEALLTSTTPQHSSLVELPTYTTRSEGVSLETFELMSTRGRAEEKMPWYAVLWNLWDLVVDVLDFSHLGNPTFLAFAASNFLLYMWYHVPYMYSAGQILGLGFDVSMISALMSIIGILSMCGDIVLGRIGDSECVNPSLLYAACMVLCGFAALIYPLQTTYLGLAAASGAFGVFLAANYSLTSTILVENITLEKFTSAYGLLLLVQGIAYLIGPSLSDWLVIITDSYDLPFYLSGLFIALSGVILTARPLYNAARRSNQRLKQTSTNENEDTTAVPCTHGSMDRESLSPPPDPLPRRSHQEGAPLSPDKAEDSPCVITPVIESEPLLHDLRCTRASATSPASAGDVPRQQTLSPHVQFDAQSPSAPVDVSSSGDEKFSTTAARSPDGGWGWVVVLASFMVNVIIGGIMFGFTLFYSHIMEHSRVGLRMIRLANFVFTAMPLLFGPIASILIGIFGCRRITIFGSILAFLGFFISSFVDNMEILLLINGILTGFGISLCQVAAIVIVAYYFEKKRSLTTGISMCGSGIGVWMFAQLLKIWPDKYEWRGTTLIFSGFILIIAVCGLLFRDLPWMTAMNEKRAKERERRRERKRNKRFGSSADSFSDNKSSAVGSTKVSDAVDIEALTTSIALQHNTVVDLPTTTKGEGVSLETFKPMSTQDQGEEKVQRYAGLWNFWEVVVYVLDFSHLRNPAFLVFAASNVLLYMWYYVPLVYTVHHSRKLGFNASMISWLMAISVIPKIFGQIILGWIGDWKCVNPSLLYAACMVLCGLAAVILPLLTMYLGIVVALGSFKFFLAANYSLTSTILVENITLEKFTNAYGFLLFVQGLGYLSLCWLFDITDSYDLLFYLSGLFIALSGVILTARPLYNAARRSNQRRKQKSTTEVNIDAVLMPISTRSYDDTHTA